jgi:hypothetical protein
MSTKPNKTSWLTIILWSVATVVVLTGVIWVISITVSRDTTITGNNFTAEQQKWIDGYKPTSRNDTPPGFEAWPKDSQCDWQTKYFPNTGLGGLCGLPPTEENAGNVCDEFCQKITGPPQDEQYNNLSREQKEWVDSHPPSRGGGALPPGFEGWTMDGKCAYQSTYEPDVMDGYCGPYSGDEVAELDRGKTCDALCQYIIARNN